MKRSIILLILVLVISLASCQKNDLQGDPDTPKIIEQLNAIVPGSSDGEISQQDFQNVIDMLNHDVLPFVSSEDKDESIEIVKYLDGIKAKVPNYLEDEDNLIEASKVIMRIYHLLARISPNDFDSNLNVSAKYVYLATAIGGDRYSSEKLKRFNKEFNAKGVQEAKKLVDKFPDHPMAYGQLAHTTYYTGGDEKEVVRLLNKCLEVDKKSEYCTEFLSKFKKG